MAGREGKVLEVEEQREWWAGGRVGEEWLKAGRVRGGLLACLCTVVRDVGL